MIFSVNSHAKTYFCARLFSDWDSKLIKTESNEVSRENFVSNERVVSTLLNNGLLAELRTSNPLKDHIEYFALQLPILTQKMLVNVTEIMVADTVYAFKDSKKSLENQLIKAHEKLTLEAEERLKSRTVTYEWYMNFFLRAVIFVDVSHRMKNSLESKTRFDFLKRKVAVLLGESKTFPYEDLSEMKLYSALSKEFSLLSKGIYFGNDLIENPLVPVLIVPVNKDIILAESAGLHFVSLVTKNKGDGRYPLQVASRQVERHLKQVNDFRSFVHNNKAKWTKYHEQIASKVLGNSKLEALYAYVLRSGLQYELTKRFGIGYKIVFSFDAHKASEYLELYFSENHKTVKEIADRSTIEAFLKIIYDIEKEDLDSQTR